MFSLQFLARSPPATDRGVSWLHYSARFVLFLDTGLACYRPRASSVSTPGHPPVAAGRHWSVVVRNMRRLARSQSAQLLGRDRCHLPPCWQERLSVGPRQGLLSIKRTGHRRFLGSSCWGLRADVQCPGMFDYCSHPSIRLIPPPPRCHHLSAYPGISVHVQMADAERGRSTPRYPRHTQTIPESHVIDRPMFLTKRRHQV